MEENKSQNSFEQLEEACLALSPSMQSSDVVNNRDFPGHGTLTLLLRVLFAHEVDACLETQLTYFALPLRLMQPSVTAGWSP